MIPADTTPAMHKLQMDMLRAAGFSRRYRLCVSMTRSVLARWREGFDRRHPGLTDEQRLRCYVKALHGRQVYKDLFDSEELPDAQ